MLNRVSRIRGEEQGTVAVIFALMLVAILVVAGVAIDMQRTVSNDSRLQSALDSAALAAAKALENAATPDAEIIAIARDAFVSNMASGHRDVSCGPADVSILREEGRVRVKAACDFETTFANLMQVDRVTLSEQAAARAAITRLDVAFMLDVSGSMKGDKLADLKIAASDAIDLLITDTTGDRVRIGFNTYATSVNAGVYADQVLDLPDWMAPKTCVSERTGVAAGTDAAPGHNVWLGLKADHCPESSVQPLTADRALLKDGIAKLKAAGNTAGHLGVAWAWYLISPEWAGIWPAASAPHAYDAPNTQKAVVLMTDGAFNTQYEWLLLGSSSKQAETLCGNMRDQGILVYSVAFDVSSASARKTMENCAGSASRYFEADDGAELTAAYQAIASQLTNLSLTE